MSFTPPIRSLAYVAAGSEGTSITALSLAGIIITGIYRNGIRLNGVNGNPANAYQAGINYINGNVTFYSGLAQNDLIIIDYVSNSTLSVVSYSVAPSQLSFNAFPGTFNGSFFQTSVFSEATYSTDATTGTLTLYSNNISYDSTRATCSIFVNGSYNQTITNTVANASTDYSFTLPAGTKTVTFRTGTQGGGDGTPSGTYINKIRFTNGTVSTKQAPSNGTKRMVVIGDSISVGETSTIPEVYGWQALLRADSNFNKKNASYGWGGVSATYLLGTVGSATLSAAVNYLNGATEQSVTIALGTNDFGLNRASAANFQTTVANFVDNLLGSLPNLKIYIIAPIYRTDQATANTFGNVLQDYRNALQTIVSTRGSFCAFLDGSTWVSSGNINTTDGVHPLNAGHVQYEAAYVSAVNAVVFKNTMLSGLTISSGTLSPAFTPGKTGYLAQQSATGTLTVTPTTSDPAATVTVNGQAVASGAASQPITIGPGNNIISIVVTSADGTATETYAVNAPVVSNLNFLANNYHMQSAGTNQYTSSTGDGYALAPVALAADGYIQFQRNSTVNDVIAFGFDTSNTLNNYADAQSHLIWAYQFYIYSGNVYTGQSGVNTTGAVRGTSAVGYYRLNRASGVVTLQYSSDGITFSTVWTFSGTNTGTLYIKTAVASANNILVNPVGFGVA